MNSFTHRLIAKMVHKRLTQDLGITLSEKYLVWGSVKPDFVKTSISHNMEDDNEPFFKHWKKLCEINPEKEMELFSVNLGVTLHFLADYFCSAHIDSNLKVNMVSHARYEFEVHEELKKFNSDFYQVAYADYSHISFREIVAYKHKLYLKRPASIMNDLNSTFELCVISAEKLFENLYGSFTNKVG